MSPFWLLFHREIFFKFPCEKRVFVNFAQMPKNMKNIFFTLLACFFIVQMSAQSAAQSQLPRVFLMGGNEKSYEALLEDYPKTLLDVCDNDMKMAFDKWLEMMKALEAYAKRINFDIKGVKVRIHVFWDTEGNIEHIGYIFRPKSRLARPEEFTAFLSSFTRQYQFPLKTRERYSHYTIASFPIFSETSN